MTLVGRLAGPPSSVCRHVLIAGFMFGSSVGTTCRRVLNGMSPTTFRDSAAKCHNNHTQAAV